MINVAVVGGTGYTGIELLRLLFAHPKVKVKTVCSRAEAGKPLTDVYPGFKGLAISGPSDVDGLVFQAPELEQLKDHDLVFFATPNGIAMNFARDLLAMHVKVIDLAADFRFKDRDLWQKWYDMEHACPDLLEQAVYGLPEMYRGSIAKANLVGSAGCYTTAVQLGLLPLLELDSVDWQRVVVDAKSGVSGAGKHLKESSLFSECGENFSAYGVSGHRHLPEICHSIERYSGKAMGLTFVPHLVPMVRGIFSTAYVHMPGGVDLDAMQARYQAFFEQECFVDVMPRQSLLSTKMVRASNMCRIALHQQNDTMLIVLSVIDNLVKGAAGQAVQNMNLMLGFDESEGLLLNPLYP